MVTKLKQKKVALPPKPVEPPRTYLNSALSALNRPIVDYVCYGIILLMAGLLVLAFSGERVGRKFGVQALYNREGGVYADCSNPVNKNNPYCKPKNEASEKAWANISKGKGKPLPFTLQP
jgi:hypothetical protein